MEEKIIGLEAMMSSKTVKDDKGPTESYFYGQEVEANQDVAAKMRTDVYRWNGSFWNLQDRQEEIARAYRWLEIGRPSRVSARNAGELATAAALKAQPLPKLAVNDIVIPTNKTYIKLENGSFISIAPERKFGMTYGIDVNITAKTGEKYIPRSIDTSSKFGSFILKSLPDEEIRRIVQEYIGYTLIHDTRHQVWQCWFGAGSNGKSILARIAQKLHRKVASVEMDKLDGFEMEDLVDASLIIVDEAPERGINSDKLKRLITGELCKINRKHTKNISTEINAKWIVLTNHKFKVSDTSDGWYRRFMPIPWTQQFKGKDRINELDKIIINSELDIVLDWALEGLQRLMQRGFFDSCPAIEALKDEFRIATDSVKAWIHENEIRVADEWEGTKMSKDEIYREYMEWCAATGRKSSVVIDTKFFERLYSSFEGLQEKMTRPRINGRQVPHLPLIINGPERTEAPAFETGYNINPEKNVIPIKKIAAGQRW